MAKLDGEYRNPLLEFYTIFQVLFEPMHIDTLGMRLHLNPSCLMHLCKEGAPVPEPPSGDWKTKMNIQLNIYSGLFKQWLGANGVRCTQRKLTLNSFF